MTPDPTAADLPMVDAHVHFWDPTKHYYPWLNDEPMIPFRYGDYSAIRRPYYPAEHLADARSHGRRSHTDKGMLSIIEGKTDQDVLTSKMIMIGKSSMASIRLKGLFAPKSAALISKRENKYFIAPEHKVKLRINGEEVYSQRELGAGDVIEIGKMKAAFSFQD